MANKDGEALTAIHYRTYGYSLRTLMLAVRSVDCYVDVDGAKKTLELVLN